MNIKRYACVTDENRDDYMFESGTGEYYSRADLIAAGCLVPVPDGEAELASEVRELRGCIMNGLPYWAYYDQCEELCLQCLIDGHPAVTAEDTIVQPVCLLPLEDVG